MLFKLNFPSTYCANCHPSMASAFTRNFYVRPSTMIDYPGSFLCNCNPSFCVAKIVKCNVRIKTMYAFKQKSVPLPTATHKSNCKYAFNENWPLENWTLEGNKIFFLDQSKHLDKVKLCPRGGVFIWGPGHKKLKYKKNIWYDIQMVC